MLSADRGSPSPRRSYGKLRRNKGLDEARTDSMASSSADGDDGIESGGLRASVDGAMDKVKKRVRRLSVDDRNVDGESGPRRLSKILSRRKRSPIKDGLSSDMQRNLSSDSGFGNMDLSANRSDSSLLLNESGRSSLLTEDNSDHDVQPIRPPLSPHHSHLGYLTTSSPEVNARINTVAYQPGSDNFNGLVASPDSIRSIPQIIEPFDPESLPQTRPSDRSPSPKDPTGEQSSISPDKAPSDTSLPTSKGRTPEIVWATTEPFTDGTSNSLSTAAEIKISQRHKEQGVLANSEIRPETPIDRGRTRLNTSSLPATPPNLVETPTTFVTPPTPTDPQADAATFLKQSSGTRASPITRVPNILSAESLKRRRAQSLNLPSKLSNSVKPPLTPTIEETKTPGGTLTQPSASAGFFASVFSAAQKAADQFSNNIGSSLGANQRPKPTLLQSPDGLGGEEVTPSPGSLPDTSVSEGERKQLAVETLGEGNLSLSQFGIVENQGLGLMSPALDGQLQNGHSQDGDIGEKAEQEAAARAVSVAYGKPPLSPAPSQVVGRPTSSGSTELSALNGDQSPSRAGHDLDKGGIKRSGSVRSKLSGRRRHRGSSATTGNTIATAGLAPPTANGTGHRLTGFAVASSKRNREFHQQFRSVPEDDYLIEDYSAALQRDILLHGRLYVSEGHICFSSNILGWVTNLVINFNEVVSVEKKSTAIIFPNAIVISTLHARNTFASFVARDSTYELLIGIWKISHPNLKSSLNGVVLDDAGTGDKTEVAEPDHSDEDDSDDGSTDEVYDEDDDDDDDAVSNVEAGNDISDAGSNLGDETASRKPSGPQLAAAIQTNAAPSKGPENADAPVNGAPTGNDFPGPSTHAPTECSDTAEHYDKPLIDTTIPAPLGKVYSIMFGPTSGAFMRKWLVEDQKSRELNFPDDKTGLDNDYKTFTFDYIKPLSNPMGPKQTKCITTNTLTAFDLEKAVSIDCGTLTPDVPSGNIFTVKTRYCLMWGPGNSTRLIANCTIEWSGKSWLKGAIEKGANDGQLDYIKSLAAAVKGAVTSSSKPPVKGTGKKGKRKGNKEGVDADEANSKKDAASAADSARSSGWGPLEPLHQILEPIVAIVRPLITSQVIIVILLGLLVFNWVASSRRGNAVGHSKYASPDRIVAYEELWRSEENVLWDWLEDRVGHDAAAHAVPLSSGQQPPQQVKLNARNVGNQLDDERMSERQMDEAIRTTEERLAVLKDTVEKKKAKKETAA